MSGSYRILKLHLVAVKGRSVVPVLARPCRFTRYQCSSVPKPSREIKDNLSDVSDSTELDGPSPKMFDLTEKPIHSKRLPTITPSSRVGQFEIALQHGKTRANFISVLENFNLNNRPRRGHMDILRVSLDFMDKFGLEGDIEVYNAMLNVFPRGRFENRTLFDAIWPKRHPQVDLALVILTKMEENVVKPSLQTYDLCEEIFGKASQPVQKCRRLAYWLTKLEEMFPHPLPKTLPEDEVELSKLAIARMSKDTIPIITYQEDVKEDESNFIIGSQTLEQKSLLENYDINIPVYVEGPYFMWIRRLKRHYYILRAQAEDKSQYSGDDEGAILAVCMTNSNSIQDNLRQWITRLEKQTPNLAKMKVIFNLKNRELEKMHTS